jgi:hypothetical protein
VNTSVVVKIEPCLQLLWGLCRVRKALVGKDGLVPLVSKHLYLKELLALFLCRLLLSPLYKSHRSISSMYLLFGN